MVRIEYLADHPDVIPLLARWFRAEWPDHYAARELEDIEQEFQSWLNRDLLPVGMVAIDGDEVVGTVVLRGKALETHPDRKPGLGGLYVAAQHRGRGIGTALVKAGMVQARELGYGAVYAGMGGAGRILERLGWARIESLLYHGEPVVLYGCTLKGAT
jgi:predicted N-acetyltransferase YhbS